MRKQNSIIDIAMALIETGRKYGLKAGAVDRIRKAEEVDLTKHITREQSDADLRYLEASAKAEKAMTNLLDHWRRGTEIEKAEKEWARRNA